MKKLALVVALVLALAVAACNSGNSDNAASGGTGGGGDVAEGFAEASPGGGGSKASDRAVSSSAVPQVGPQVVKTATLRLGIAHGSFEDKVGEAHAVADSYAGFVVESFASQGSGKRIAEGSLVLRIPAESFDSALSRLRELGKVESLEERGRDVSKEFVDLNARVRQLRAVEAQLLELLQRADDVPAALAVQNQLSQVQLDLEQARGRLQPVPSSHGPKRSMLSIGACKSSTSVPLARVARARATPVFAKTIHCISDRPSNAPSPCGNSMRSWGRLPKA